MMGGSIERRGDLQDIDRAPGRLCLDGGASALTKGNLSSHLAKLEETGCVKIEKTGPDQCIPPKGRFKKDGDRCVWDANDSGTDQCRPNASQ